MNEYHLMSPHFSRKKGLQGVSARQRKGPLRGGASRPARPRPLEAGALTFVIFRVKVYHLLGASLRTQLQQGVSALQCSTFHPEKSGIYHFLINFSSGMGEWYMKVVFEVLILFSLLSLISFT